MLRERGIGLGPLIEVNQSPEQLHLEVPYEIKEYLAFLVDDAIDRKYGDTFPERLLGSLVKPLKDTNFRLNRRRFEQLEKLLGPEAIEPLKKTVVENRFKALQGVAAKLAGQVGITAALAQGTLSPESVATFILGTVGSVVGSVVESEDRKKAYIETHEKALKIAKQLNAKFLPDIYRWPGEEKKNLAEDLAEAWARGENLGRPQLAALTWAILNVGTLFANGQQQLSFVLSGGEYLVLRLQDLTIRRAFSERKVQTRARVVRGRVMKADEVLVGNNLDNTLLNMRSRSNLLGEWRKQRGFNIILQSLLQAGIPILAIAKRLDALAISLGSQLATQWVGTVANRHYYSLAKAGLDKLDRLFVDIENNKTSLLPYSKLLDHCRQFKEDPEHLRWVMTEAYLKRKNPDAVAIISPFTLSYTGQEKGELILNDSLVLHRGFYNLSGTSRAGSSSFFDALEKRKNIVETHESFYRFGLGDNSEWRGLHDMDPYEIWKLFANTTPEKEEIDLSPAVLFANNIKDIVPSGTFFDQEVDGIFKRYHQDDSDHSLTNDEHDAFTVCLQLLAGLYSRDEIYKMELPKGVKKLVYRLLPYFRPEKATKVLTDQLLDFTVNFRGREVTIFNHVGDEEIFSEGEGGEDFVDDIKMIKSIANFSDLPSSTRAKLRIFDTLRKAERNGARIVSIDKTLDVIPAIDFPIWYKYLSDWNKRVGATILVGTNRPDHRKYIKDSEDFNGTIWFKPDGKKNNVYLNTKKNK